MLATHEENTVAFDSLRVCSGSHCALLHVHDITSGHHCYCVWPNHCLDLPVNVLASTLETCSTPLGFVLDKGVVVVYPWSVVSGALRTGAAVPHLAFRAGPCTRVVEPGHSLVCTQPKTPVKHPPDSSEVLDTDPASTLTIGWCPLGTHRSPLLSGEPLGAHSPEE